MLVKILFPITSIFILTYVTYSLLMVKEEDFETNIIGEQPNAD
jgi:hypothetical protein